MLLSMAARSGASVKKSSWKVLREGQHQRLALIEHIDLLALALGELVALHDAEHGHHGAQSEEDEREEPYPPEARFDVFQRFEFHFFVVLSGLSLLLSRTGKGAADMQLNRYKSDRLHSINGRRTTLRHPSWRGYRLGGRCRRSRRISICRRAQRLCRSKLRSRRPRHRQRTTKRG